MSDQAFILIIFTFLPVQLDKDGPLVANNLAWSFPNAKNLLNTALNAIHTPGQEYR